MKVFFITLSGLKFVTIEEIHITMSTVTIKPYSHEASIFLVIQRSFGKGIINRMLYCKQSTEKLCFHLTLLNWQKKTLHTLMFVH